ncbi:MAG: DNA-3-methyladenine glycosylase 2 family protein [Acidimicrobiia bacterium]|nr:DNA-3-methyladenine glycosylase 2 family protein [Acidimicrobiia bacterium]
MAAESLVGALTPSQFPRLGPDGLAAGVASLTAADSRLATLVDRNGSPPLWDRSEGFPTLVKVILEQQVSLASAAAAYRRLAAALGEVEPTGFLRLTDPELLAIGFSRQKAGYCRGLATGILDGSIELDGLNVLPDDAARNRLMGIKGIGPWTADVYLMFALGRPDVWPPGDRALLVALGSLLDQPPLDSAVAVEYATRWRPWRSVAARILWHDYLGGTDGPA